MILIKNGRLVDPLSKRDEVVDIVIEKDKIKEIGKNLNQDGVEYIIDATGCVVAPGLIDIHVHFRDQVLHIKKIYLAVQKLLQRVDLQLLYVWQIQNQ